jgi:hypothetical protein
MTKESKHILERLKEQREKINARIQATEARLKNSERKKDTRRKILVGSYYLDKATKDNTIDEIKKALDKFLTRNSDRILFDLKLLPENK